MVTERRQTSSVWSWVFLFSLIVSLITTFLPGGGFISFQQAMIIIVFSWILMFIAYLKNAGFKGGFMMNARNSHTERTKALLLLAAGVLSLIGACLAVTIFSTSIGPLAIMLGMILGLLTALCLVSGASTLQRLEHQHQERVKHAEHQ